MNRATGEVREETGREVIFFKFIQLFEERGVEIPQAFFKKELALRVTTQICDKNSTDLVCARNLI